MSEVIKRDKRVRVLSQLYATMKRDRDTATAALVSVWRTQLAEHWRGFEALQDAVIDRAGVLEIEEQHKVYDDAYAYHYKASIILAELSEDLSMSAFDDQGAAAGVAAAGAASVHAKIAADAAAVRAAAVVTQQQIQLRHATTLRRLQTMCQNIANNVDGIQAVQIEAQRAALEQLYAAYQEAGLEYIANGAAPDDVLEDEAANTLLYLNAAGILTHAQQQHAAPPAREPAVRDADALRVPQLSITPFDGKLAKWEAFRESFVHGIHERANLPAVQKLQYLKSVLRGEAEELVRNFALTAANYDSAWTLLNDRYNNRRELITAHLRMLTTLASCSETADDLRTLSNKTASARLALTNLDRPTAHWDDWLVFHVCDKLGRETRNLWEQSLVGDQLPTWAQLDAFLQGRIRALSSVGAVPAVRTTNRQASAPHPKVRAHQTLSQKQRVSTSQSPVRQYSCPCCSESHLLHFCEQFRRMTPPERRVMVADKSLCFVCLASGHMAQQCNSTKVCSTCNAKHNTMLHNSEVRSNRAALAASVTRRERPPVMLATAIVNVRDSAGQRHPVRALLDQGGDWSFASTNLAHTLQLPHKRENEELSGIGGVHAGTVKHSVVIEVSDCHGSGFVIDVDAFLLRRVTSELRCIPDVDVARWPHTAGLQLADPDLMYPHDVELVLGGEIYNKILLPGLRQEDGYPMLQRSQFGWFASGAIERRDETSHTPKPAANHIRMHHATVDAQLARFWEIEETSTTRAKTAEENQCETMFEQTVKRDDSGRIHVRLPMKHDVVIFGESQRFAVQRQLQIERKFNTHPEFAERYREFMRQYMQLGHMHEVVGATVDLTRNRAMLPASRREFYIPHHAVVKEASTSTKLRVVFDASRRSTNGTSLNEQMLIGPRLQDDLTFIMMRWRKFRVAFCSDVEKMYRQIAVDHPDTDLQRIVWRERDDEPMRVFRLCTVTYGTAAAPYLAVKSLQTLAQLERERYPVGAELALNNFYVDDILGGADTVAECLEAQAQLRSLMTSGGMVLRKWASNCEDVLSMVDPADRESTLPLNIDDGSNINTLGVQWNPACDKLCFKISIPGDTEKCTKRSFLSAAARLFDPLGWLAPCTIVVKILFQSLWKTQIDWDDELPRDIQQKWTELRTSLDILKAVRIERWIGTAATCDVELHGFCDASMAAYAAVVFVRVRDTNHTVKVHNVCAKTKVAPTKVISLPRLELCGAALLVKLLTDVKAAMQWPDVTVTCWTDSTIVLAWLHGHPSAFNIFVANRAAEIQRHVPAEHWHHVRSGDNPADCASRGITPSQLLHHRLWWTGPPWLSEEMNEWPQQSPVPAATDEMRVRMNVAIVTASNDEDIMRRYSTWSKLVRITAYCNRFARNSQIKKAEKWRRTDGLLSSAELASARNTWVRTAQAVAYADELRCLRGGKDISKSSDLRALNPVLSSQNIMCLGGRLMNARGLRSSSRTPAIVPRRTDVSALLVRDAHMKTMHGGPALMLAYLRREYWIVDGPNEVRRFVQKCTKCFRYAARPQHQMMGALPAARVVPSRPFIHCAMDYSGAIMVRSAPGRGHKAHKAYVAVFVCLATKAVHIELAGDLTTAGFIAAYERFTARRGCCTDIYSDNATNFVGAAKFLRTERELFNARVQTTLANRGTTWHFSPPLSPHFNGLAESAIRSIKHHIRRVLGETTLTYEELTTMLTKIEACLNSRPLCPVNNDPESFDALTPGHFLVGEPLTAIAHRDLLSHNPSALTRWQQTQQFVQRVWKRWSADYLHTLQQRRKWQTPINNLQVGDMVLLLEDNLPPAKWAIGRIAEVHPGDDGHVRVVTIRTQHSIFKRSVVKVARLPVDVGQEENAASTDTTSEDVTADPV